MNPEDVAASHAGETPAVRWNWIPKRLRFLNFSAAWLLLLLQRTPLLRWASTAAEFAPSRVVALLKASAVTAASLGAVHSLAGATQFVISNTSVSGTVGTAITPVAFSVTGAQTPAGSYRVSGTLPPGLTVTNASSSGVVNGTSGSITGTPTTAGSYSISVYAYEHTNASGDSFGPATIRFTITGSSSTAPAITTQPSSQSVAVGGSATFTVAATGSPTPTYQWQKDGTALSGATNASLSLSNLQTSSAGTYAVVVSNSAGGVTSSSATLTVLTSGPTIAVQPQSQHVALGGSVSLSVVASGSGLSYQWKKDGAAIVGATSSALNFASASTDTVGFYSVVVSSAGSTTESSVAIVTVATGGTSRLINVATRGYVPVGGALIPGFVLRGNASKSLVIRAVGPTLSNFGIQGTLTDPMMDVIPLGSTTAVASNDNWEGAASLQSAFTRVGAFPLAASGSTDSSVETSLPASGTTGYTVRVMSKNTAVAGIALAEVYDEEALTSAVRIVNVSTNGYVGTGEQALVPGFVIGGTAPKQLLIRAVGPGLAPFGVSGAIADPQFSVVPSGKDFAVVTSDNWGGSAELQAAFTQAGAFALPAGSQDAAAIVRLPPGGYTVVVSGVGGTTGTALVEIYDLDP